MDPKPKTAPYLPFQTFMSALDNIASVGVPNVIDRHSFPSFSGAAVSATVSALKFFGLIDNDGRPEAALHTLVMDKDGRKQAIKALLEQHYSNVIALDLARTTPPQFDAAFTVELYNVTGDTKTKAKTFFVKAAQFADIPLSKLLLNKSRSSGTRKTRKPKANAPNQTGTIGTTLPPPAIPPPLTGTTKTIQLGSGGTLTLSLNVNILELKGTDRKFVFDLIDKIEAHENPGEQSAGGEVMP